MVVPSSRNGACSICIVLYNFVYEENKQTSKGKEDRFVLYFFILEVFIFWSRNCCENLPLKIFNCNHINYYSLGIWFFKYGLWKTTVENKPLFKSSSVFVPCSPIACLLTRWGPGRAQQHSLLLMLFSRLLPSFFSIFIWLSWIQFWVRTYVPSICRAM